MVRSVKELWNSSEKPSKACATRLVLTRPAMFVPDPFPYAGARLEQFYPVKKATDDALA